jgi:starch synthase
MEILHVSAECSPLARVGGLADAVASLVKNQVKNGMTPRVVIPCYGFRNGSEAKMSSLFKAHMRLGKLHFDYEVLEMVNHKEFQILCVCIRGLFDRPVPYGHDDDPERFLGFQLAVLDWIKNLKQKPDMIHCHDHHSAMIPFFMKYAMDFQELAEIPTVLTVHNAKFQGQYGYDKLRYFPQFALTSIGMLDWDGIINPLATGIKSSWKVTASSKAHLKKLMNRSYGLEQLIESEKIKFSYLWGDANEMAFDPAKDIQLTSK